MAKERFKITPASYFALIKDGQVLLQLRKNTGYRDGEYGLVAGHVEPHESFAQALIREIEEEAGIKLKYRNEDYSNRQSLFSALQYQTPRYEQ